MAGCRGPLARNAPNLCSSECRAQWKIPGDETETFPKARNQFRDFISWNYSTQSPVPNRYYYQQILRCHQRMTPVLANVTWSLCQKRYRYRASYPIAAAFH